MHKTYPRTRQSPFPPFSRLSLLSVLFVAALGLGGCGYNTMVSMREQVEAAWAQVENQLQRRNDLIPNLVEVTKGYAAHERGVFESVAEARAKLIGAGTRGEKIEAANEVSSALSRLLALSERYPELKADRQFARLSDELAGTENRIATERRRYNEAVQTYNTYIKSFPAVLSAKMFGFEPEKYFEAPKEAQQVPQVQF
ncbi:MAG: LemA family protein [Thermodesulfobacteriota bacterium]